MQKRKSIFQIVCNNSILAKLSKEKMSEIQAKIEADRKMLETKKDMEEEERDRVKMDLETKEQELRKAQ